MARQSNINEPELESGRELFEQKRYEEALLKFEEILKHDTTDEEALRLRPLCQDLIAKDAYNLALGSARDGDSKTAVVYARKALKYRPNYLEAEHLLKVLSGTEGPPITDISKELYAESLDAIIEGDPKQALELAQKALDHYPDNVEARRMVERLSQRGAGTPK
ncbi:MAG: hypothetical protein IPP35_00130 [Elusimicrobia bacterium]|nr:hypothetical protein [Elusimicrobiota bacterium]